MLKVIMLGRLVKDAEVRSTQSGKSVASFTVACNGETKDAKPEFVKCIAWEKTADIVSKYMSKGSQGYFEGRLQTREYTDKSGAKRYITEVIVSKIEFCGGKAENNAPQGYKSTSDQWGKSAPADDDIPF